LGGAVNCDYGHRLLSLDGPSLYYQTNPGAVVALEAQSGLVRRVARRSTELPMDWQLPHRRLQSVGVTR
jgi:hypothetical protein